MMTKLVRCARRRWGRPGQGPGCESPWRRNRRRDPRQRLYLEAVLASLPAIVWTTDRELRVTSIRGAELERWGLQPEQLEGQPMAEVLSGEPRSAFALAEHERALAGESRAYDLPWGDRVYNVRITPVRDADGTVDGVAGVSVDVTDLRQFDRVEQARRESDERYQALRNALSFGVLHLGLDGSIHIANDAATRLLGYTADELRQLSILDITHPDDIPVTRANLGRYDAGTAWSMQLEKRYVRKDGRAITVLLNSALVSGGMWGRRSIVVQFVDVTRRKELEAQVYQAQKMEAVGQLASGVAHDFNNHLTIIRSYTDLLLNDLDLADPRRQDLEEIRRAAEGAGGLTGRLLAFSRQQVVEPQHLVLETQLDGLQKLLRRLIGEEFSLVTDFARPGSLIHMDAGQLEQIVMNLVINARDAMPGGGPITIRTGVVEAAGDLPRFATISVVDTGVGIDPETRHRIFEPFFTTKESGKGTGLGLAMVQAAVEQAGGSITVESSPGRGSTFTVHLPVHELGAGELPAGETTGRDSRLPRGTETILLVEDDSAVRRAAQQMLERCGYTVLAPASSIEALALAEWHLGVIDLMLADVVMPGLSGPQLVERVRMFRPGTRMMYMSGYVGDPLVRTGLTESHAPFLHKPLSLETLARRVRDELDIRPGTIG